MSETSTILPAIKLALGGLPGTRIFRNQVGLAWVGKPPHLTRITTGLHVGSADLIGWNTYTIRPEDVGKRVAVFLSCEAKTAVGVKSPKQINWAAQVAGAGGISFFATSGEEALTRLNEWRPM